MLAAGEQPTATGEKAYSKRANAKPAKVKSANHNLTMKKNHRKIMKREAMQSEPRYSTA